MNEIFILDLGSGNSCKNDEKIIDEMINTIAEIDQRRKFILKWQLFDKAGENIPLKREMFQHAHMEATIKGFMCTASVFNLDDLMFLLNFNVPFVKIANRLDLYHLAGEVPRKIPVIVSRPSFETKDENLSFTTPMFCVSKYPAEIKDYENQLSVAELKMGISDHTSTWEFFERYNPKVYECHFVLEHDNNNPDGGIFARTPQDLRYIINYI